MSVKQYVVRGKKLWRIDVWLTRPDGTQQRYSKRKIPTREQAVALEATKIKEAFEGRYLPERQAAKTRAPSLTVADAWALYEPKGKRDDDSHGTDCGRAAHLRRHLGSKAASELSLADVEEYRAARLAEKTRRGGPPAPGTLDREVELLKRVLNYAVAMKKLNVNPLASVPLLKKKNVRKVILDEAAFTRLLTAAVEWLKPILLVAFDTGMRKEEILSLRWKGQTDAYGLDLKARTIALADDDTKTDEPRTIPLTARVVTALRAIPRRLGSPFVFVNPDSGEPWKDIKKAFARACREAGLEAIWFHDLRRSFVTKARRAGIPESVVMRFSGHRTRAVFDRYNVVDESDAVEAVGRLEAAAGPAGRVLDEVGEGGAEDAKAPRS